MNVAWRYRRLVLLACALVIASGVYVGVRRSKEDPVLRTVLRGIEFNQSLLHSIRITFREERTQPEEARQWIRSHWMGTQPGAQDEGRTTISLFPAKVVTLGTLVMKGKKCRLERKQVYPKVDFASDPQRQEEIVFNGKDLFRYYPRGEEAYIHRGSDEMKIGGIERIIGVSPATDRRARVTLVGMESVDGIPCYLLEARVSESRFGTNDKTLTHWWIDADRGFRPRRIQIYWPDGEIHKVEKFDDFREHDEGVWLPHKITNQQYSSTARRGKRFQWTDTTYTIQEVQVNPDISDSTFNIGFPSGTRIYDARPEEPELQVQE